MLIEILIALLLVGWGITEIFPHDTWVPFYIIAGVILAYLLFRFFTGKNDGTMGIDDRRRR